jgi:hypothetical protein
MSIVLITLKRCNRIKDTPGATTLNKKKMVKSAHLLSMGAKYKLVISTSELYAGTKRLIKMPYVGIKRGKNTHENI